MAYAFLQTTNQFTNGAGTTRTAAITYAGTETSLVIVGFAGGAASCTVTDGVNTYQQVGTYHFLGSGSLGLFQASNVAAGATTITMTTNASAAWRGIAVCTYSGLANTLSTVNVFNEQNAPTTATDAVTTTNMTPGSQPAMVFAFSIDNTGTAAISAGTANSPTSRSTLSVWQSALGFFGQVEDFRITSTSAVAATFTATSASSHTDTFGAIFAEAGQAPVTSPAGAIMSDLNLLLAPLALFNGINPTVNIAATSATSAQVTLPTPVSNAQGGMSQVQVFNAGTTTVFVAFGSAASAVATQTNSYPVPAGFIVTLTPPAGSTTAAAISAAAAGPVYFTSANGR